MDKAYDADALIEQLTQQEIIPVIPPKANRKEPREYDKPIRVVPVDNFLIYKNIIRLDRPN